MKIPEVLAPAGSWDRLTSAVAYGADAVYIGGKMFGMRAAPANFDLDALRKAVQYCHERHVKLYVTCNVLPRNEEIEGLEEYVRYLDNIGVDALIVADIGIFRLARRIAPRMDMHISTQAGVVNYLAARELYDMGASRVVLARELSLEEIRTIRDKTPEKLEIEAFVHGAMCMSFSGRCLISSYMTGRDANRGACTQPCRWSYHVVEEKRPGVYYPVMENEEGTFFFNAEDLCMIEHLDRLAQAGISSFKIEGRAKSAYYTASVTHAYRCAVDILAQNPEQYSLPEWLREEPNKISHRPYSTGFYFTENRPGQHYQGANYVCDWDVIAMVEGWEDGWLLCSERNRFFVGQEAEVMVPGAAPYPLLIRRIIKEDGTEVDVSRHAMEKIKIPSERAFPVGAYIRSRSEKEAGTTI